MAPVVWYFPFSVLRDYAWETALSTPKNVSFLESFEKLLIFLKNLS